MMKIRPATIDDAKLLFEWRNDALTCAMSRNAAPVEWQQHVDWLSARLMREKPNLFIAVMDTRAVGTFRVDDDEISYTIAPDCRGYGFSVQMLMAARKAFGVLRAQIYECNVASIKVAERAGLAVKIIAG